MNGLLPIVCGMGLQDALNPCIFMACAFFIFLRVNQLRIIFVLIYVAGLLEFSFGPAQVVIFDKNFILAAKVLYFVLGAGAFVLGILFFKDWISLRRDLPVNEKIRPLLTGGLQAVLITIALGLVLSALAALWPINNYIMLLGNEAFIKGQWPMVLPLLISYILASMWPLWFVWAFLSIKNLQPSLFKIVCASIFFTASSCMIFIFK